MRTTLNLDPEVLTKVRILARQRGVSLGTVVSELIRKAWFADIGIDSWATCPTTENGFVRSTP
jgi:hypothetical protein